MKVDEDSAVLREVRYRFGEFELDLDAYTLTRAGALLHIRRKAFDVLRFLIEQRRRVVTKEELLDAVWADSQVAQVAVPWTICHARRVLGQRTVDKYPIETMHGRGYRFVAVVEVLSARASAPPPADERPSQAPAPQTPFVGRQQAMALLHTRLAEARTGNGSLAALVGEPGIGKTRCVDELAAHACAQGFALFSGRSTEDTVAPVFWPWIQVLRDIASGRPGLREAAHGLLARLAASDSAADLTDVQRVPGNFWLFDRVSSLLRDAAREGPVLLLLEDLHWADLGSIQLLTFIAPELHEHGTLVVTTQRDRHSAGDPRELGRLSRHAAVRIELEALTLDEVGQYVGLVAQTGVADPELCAVLLRATAGYPLFLLHTVNDLVTRHGRDKLGSLAPELVKPAKSARDVLRSGLDTLDERTRRVLEVASVLGESFALATLQQLCGLATEELLSALEAASAEGFVLAEPPHEFRFMHALLRAALYDDLATSDRASQHRRAAQVLERSAYDHGRHGEIAHHYYRSIALGDYGRVAEAAEQAAQAAARLQAFSDAAKFSCWALEAQALVLPQQPRARAELLWQHARFEQLAGNGQDALRTTGLLIEVARRHGYIDLLLEAARIVRPTHLMGARADPQVCTILEDALRALPDGANALRIKALSQLSWIPPYAHDMKRSKELSAEALALARHSSEPDSLRVALHARLYALSGPDDIDALLEVTDEMLRRDGAPRTSVSLEALSARHAAQISRGELVQADATLASYGHLAREQKWPEAIWTHDRLSAQRKLLAGDFAAAEASMAGLRARSRRLCLRHGAALSAIAHAALIIQRDGPRAFASRWDTSHFSLAIHDAMPSVRPGIARLCASLGQRGPAKSVLENMVGDGGFALPRERSYLNALANLGMLAIELADRPRAERIYEELAPYPHHNTPDAVLLYEGSVSRFLAQLAAFVGRDERVAQHFDDALAMNERLGLRPQLAHSYCAYSRWLLGHSHGPARRVGRELQVRAIELAQTLGMSWLAAAARAVG